ncbi:MAG: QacE family quaternary ammonium compound efflux SMR transporter [Candidatus Methanoplasma sp.]|jgi:quaternary ammonium compound-resistance protein SugE|nr:QacE family quaternary ammonium compound efflux SMR transporter [Candidatus Methanoplasma sp.]
MKPWSWVIVGGTFETGWALCMKMSEGFTDIPWTIATLILIFVSVYLLDCGLKRGIPVGSGYAVWVGVGGIGGIVMGIIVFGDSMLWSRLMFAAIIIIGIIGVELTSNPKAGKDNQDS